MWPLRTSLPRRVTKKGRLEAPAVTSYQKGPLRSHFERPFWRNRGPGCDVPLTGPVYVSANGYLRPFRQGPVRQGCQALFARGHVLVARLFTERRRLGTGWAATFGNPPTRFWESADREAPAGGHGNAALRCWGPSQDGMDQRYCAALRRNSSSSAGGANLNVFLTPLGLRTSGASPQARRGPVRSYRTGPRALMRDLSAS